MVVAVLAIAGGLALLLRRSRRPAKRRLDDVDLGAGVYFFSSSTCDTCHAARESLYRMVVPGSLTEYMWEESPDMFEMLGVDVVPATLVVTDHRSAVLYPGVPKTLLGIGDP